jgi:hypothetical protein
VVRRETRQDGSIAVAVRFSKMLRADQTRLDKLLHLMDQNENETAADDAMPIVETLELDFADEQELHDRLLQIANGRLSLIVYRAYQVEQSIELLLNGTKMNPAIQLRARVIGQETLFCPWTEQNFIKMELQLEHPGEDLRRIARRQRSGTRQTVESMSLR